MKTKCKRFRLKFLFDEINVYLLHVRVSLFFPFLRLIVGSQTKYAEYVVVHFLLTDFLKYCIITTLKMYNKVIMLVFFALYYVSRFMSDTRRRGYEGARDRLCSHNK